jgi:hypothetical protein
MGQRTPADLGLREGEVTFSCREGVTQMQRRLFGLLTRPAAPVAPLARAWPVGPTGQGDRRTGELENWEPTGCNPVPLSIAGAPSFCRKGFGSSVGEGDDEIGQGAAQVKNAVPLSFVEVTSGLENGIQSFCRKSFCTIGSAGDWEMGVN